MKINSKKSLVLRCSKGFTLIELLIVVGIIGMLAAIVMAALNNARNRGGDAGVQSNLKNAIAQGEIFFGTNTAVANSYTNFCSITTPIGGAITIYPLMIAAVKAGGLASYGINNVPAASTSLATCNNSASAWAAEVPLKSAGLNKMWCVDSVGHSKQTSATIGATTVCP